MTLSAVALVAVVAFATAFVVERVRSAANAELAQRFGQELRDMEWSMRLAYALPLHDIREERARVKERIGSIESLMKKRGRSGEAAGHGALGRGNLVLREYEKARQHLQRAFEVDRTPALALALGEAYAGLYTTATNAADRIPSKALREEKKKAIDRELGARALDFLNKGREAALESPALVEGRMLYLKHEWDRALELSEKAHAAAPMRAEAKLLEGRIRSARATEKRAAGDLDRAAREYLMANAAFEAAAELSRSDPEVHEAACALGRHFVMLAVQQGQPPDSAYARAVVACDRATSVDPDSSPAYQEKVWIYWQVADYAKEHGGDWKKLVESAVNAGLEAVRAGPRDAGAHGMLGLAYSTDAEFSASEGRDPKGALEKAIASLKRALEIDSHHVTALNELGNVLSVKAENEDDSGLDPRGSYRESIRMFERILEFKPDSASALNNLGTNMHLLSRADFDRGLDPRPGCQKALAAIAGALKVNPRMFAAMTNRSLVHTLLADEALSRGEDPGKHLRSALEDLDAALRVAPNDPIAAELAGRVLLRQTEYEIETAADEQASLREAKARLAKAQELNPSSVAVLRYIGGLAALQADGLRRRGQNPEAALAEGRAAFAKAFAIQRSTTSLIGVGNLELVAVRWAVDHRQSPEAAWERGRKALDEALSRNPSRIDAAVLLGRLCRFSAEFGLSQRPPWSRTTEMLAKGRECAAKALAINPSSPEIRALDAAIAILQAQANRGEGTPNLEEPKARLRTALLENRLLENEYGALAGTRAGK